MEAIILAGGFGTRLQSVVKDVPKPMAEVNDQPFLKYILDFVIKNNITKVVLAVSYKYEIITDYFANHYKDLEIEYSIEKDALGTGGAIRQALDKVNGDKVFVLNGDTFFNIEFANMLQIHNQCKSDITIALKEMTNFDRYGSVKINNSHQVISFEEKMFIEKGYINGGIYLLNKTVFDQFQLNQNFSFESFLEKNVLDLNISASIEADSYFIDIGIPEDYKKANKDFKDLF